MNPFIRAHRCLEKVIIAHNNLVAFHTALNDAANEFRKLHKDASNDSRDEIESILKLLEKIRTTVDSSKFKESMTVAMRLGMTIEHQEKDEKFAKAVEEDRKRREARERYDKGAT